MKEITKETVNVPNCMGVTDNYSRMYRLHTGLVIPVIYRHEPIGFTNEGLELFLNKIELTKKSRILIGAPNAGKYKSNLQYGDSKIYVTYLGRYSTTMTPLHRIFQNHQLKHYTKYCLCQRTKFIGLMSTIFLEWFVQLWHRNVETKV